MTEILTERVAPVPKHAASTEVLVEDEITVVPRHAARTDPLAEPVTPEDVVITMEAFTPTENLVPVDERLKPTDETRTATVLVAESFVTPIEVLMVEDEREPTPAVRMPRWKGALIALASLVFVYGLALGVLTAGGAVFHAVDPSRHVDPFAALHNHWVVGALIAIGILWLLPPYPWAKRLFVSRALLRPLPASETEGGATG